MTSRPRAAMPLRTSVRLVAGMAIVLQVTPTPARDRSRLHLSSTVAALSLTSDSDQQISNYLCGSASVDRERTNVIAVARSSTVSRDVVREARANPPVKWRPAVVTSRASNRRLRIGADPDWWPIASGQHGPVPDPRERDSRVRCVRCRRRPSPNPTPGVRRRVARHVPRNPRRQR